MAYFKTRFIEDQTFFDDILEENQAKSLFAEHDTEIKSKKEGLTRTKMMSTLLYKNITREQKNKIRDKMSDEYDAAHVDNEADVETEEVSDAE